MLPTIRSPVYPRHPRPPKNVCVHHGGEGNPCGRGHCPQQDPGAQEDGVCGVRHGGDQTEAAGEVLQLHGYHRHDLLPLQRHTALLLPLQAGGAQEHDCRTGRSNASKHVTALTCVMWSLKTVDEKKKYQFYLSDFYWQTNQHIDTVKAEVHFVAKQSHIAFMDMFI